MVSSAFSLYRNQYRSLQFSEVYDEKSSGECILPDGARDE